MERPGSSSIDQKEASRRATSTLATAVPVGHLPELDLQVGVDPVPPVRCEGVEDDPSLVRQEPPGLVGRQVVRHGGGAVDGGVPDSESFVPQQRQPQVVPNVGVGQEDPVEGPSLGRALPEGRLGDEVDLSRDVRGGVHEVEPLRAGLHQRQ